MSFRIGNTFVNVELRGLPSHLWVIISDADDVSSEVVIVNFTTWRKSVWAEKSCIIEKGEHPFVHHATYVNYRDARIVALDKLEQLKERGCLTENADVSDALLDKILLGATKSQFVPMRVLGLLEDQGLI